MKSQQAVENNKKSVVLTIIGAVIMILLTVAKVIPSSKIAGYSVFVGIAFFFITEAAGKEKGSGSGLRFNTIPADLKRSGVIFWLLLPIVSGIITNIVGGLIFHKEFFEHIVGRADDLLSFDKIALLIFQIIIAAFGEEIAYRGFFFGKASKIFPVWVCAVVSSAVFAAGHISAGNIGIVIYDIAGVFIDSLIFTMVYYRSGNCVISTFSHILANTAALVEVFIML